MKRLMLLLAGFLILILSGCSHEQIPSNCPEGTLGMSFSGDIQPIFDASCTSCHSGGPSPNLSPGLAYDEIIDGGYVEGPENACESVLYQVFSGSHSGRATEEEILKILGWIQAEAQDN